MFGFWIGSQIRNAEERIKEFKRQVHVAVVTLLQGLVTFGATALVGFGQGAIPI